MSKQLYLANVGRTIFMDCKNSQVIGMADTLTQATFNLTVQEEELRGGPGNPLLASTFHDQSMELSFTDALISTDMIGAMIGATNSATGKATGGLWLANVDGGVETTASQTSVTLTGINTSTSAPIYNRDTENQSYVCYIRPQAAAGQWEVAKIVNSGANATVTRATGSFDGAKWCVKYFKAGQNTDTTFNLNADFVPSVLHSISYIDVYEAGVAGCAGGTGTSTGRAVGQLVIDIPLFQLNNGLNLSLSTTPGTYDISGKALASETGSCSGSAKSFGTIYYCATT